MQPKNNMAFRVCLSVLLLLLIISPGCTKKTEEPLRIGTNLWPGYEPLYLAQKLDYLKPDLVTPVQFRSSSETISAFRSRTIDAAALTLDELLSVAQFESNISIILVTDISLGADVLMARPEIRDLGSLRGRRVGVETTAAGAYMLSKALNRAGLKDSDINIVNLNADEHESAFTQKRVDAVITFEPVRSRLLNTGAKILFDSSNIPGEIVDVIVVRKDYLRSQRGRVETLLKAWFRTLDYMKEHPEDAAEKLKVRLGISADEVKAAASGLKFPDRDENSSLLRGEQPRLLNTMSMIEEHMISHKLIYKKIELMHLYDRELLDQIYR